jgi:hypothetical protein
MSFNQQAKKAFELLDTVNWKTTGKNLLSEVQDGFFGDKLEGLKTKGIVAAKGYGRDFAKTAIDWVDNASKAILSPAEGAALMAGQYELMFAGVAVGTALDWIREKADGFFADDDKKGDEGYNVGDLVIIDWGSRTRRKLFGAGMGFDPFVMEEIAEETQEHDFEPAIALGQANDDGFLRIIDLSKAKPVTEDVNIFDVRKLNKEEAGERLTQNPGLERAIDDLKNQSKQAASRTRDQELDVHTNIQPGEQVTWNEKVWEIDTVDRVAARIRNYENGNIVDVKLDELKPAPNLHENKNLPGGQSFRSAPRGTDSGTFKWMQQASRPEVYELVCIVRCFGNKLYSVASCTDSTVIEDVPGFDLFNNVGFDCTAFGRLAEFAVLCYEGDEREIESFNLAPQGSAGYLSQVMIDLKLSGNRRQEIGGCVAPKGVTKVLFQTSATSGEVQIVDGPEKARARDAAAEMGELAGTNTGGHKVRAEFANPAPVVIDMSSTSGASGGGGMGMLFLIAGAALIFLTV